MRALSRRLMMNPRLPAGVQVGGHGIAGGGDRPERGRGDQWPVTREVLAQQVHALSRAGEDVTLPQPHAVQVQFTPRPSGQARWRDRSAAQASGVGIDDAGRQAPGGVFEEHAEHCGLVQAADPGFRPADRPGAVPARDGSGAGGMHLAAAVRFGDRDSGERASEQAGQPPVPYRGAGVGGDQPTVAKPGRIPQVDVVVATDERTDLRICLTEA